MSQPKIKRGYSQLVVFLLYFSGPWDANAAGAKFICERNDVGTVISSEIGYIAKMLPELTEEQRQEVGELLQALEENDDVHRVWAAVK